MSCLGGDGGRTPPKLLSCRVQRTLDILIKVLKMMEKAKYNVHVNLGISTELLSRRIFRGSLSILLV